MDFLTCTSLVDETGEAPSIALLGVAGTVLVLLASVTLSKWAREVFAHKALMERREKQAVEAKGAAVARAGEQATFGAKQHIERKSPAAKVYPEYSIEDVRLHSSAKDAWVAIGDGVYDVTKWATYHPGGERNIIDISGR